MSCKIDILDPGKDTVVILDALLADLGLLYEKAYFHRCLADGAGRCVVMARVSGVPAGIAVFNPLPAYPPFRRLGVPEIQDLNVVSGFRRQGLGAALVRFCEDLARAGGADMIGIGVGLDASYGAAQRLYVRLGYVPDGAGICYDGVSVHPGAVYPVDDALCLMMIKDLPSN